jgi:pimeloyl-ACP methyl ester carboxylesterase
MPARRLIFLPGVGGDAAFWQPVSEHLPDEWEKIYLGWPGLGRNPSDTAVNSYDDLVSVVEAQLGDQPIDLIAHSMGGVIAINVALRNPHKVRRLVLCATSGGVDVQALGATDWRAEYRQAFPQVANWVTSERPYLSGAPEQVSQPTLLIWGDSDPISPVAVGEHLVSRIAQARLTLIKGGDHDLAIRHAREVACEIHRHLSD